MKRFSILILAAFCISLSVTAAAASKKPTKIYHKTWIDLNKNGKKDIYEDPSRTVDERIADLLSQMTLEEKTCQLVTLYGYRRVLADSLPTPEWKNKIWKDGMGAIDEHLNGFYQWGKPIVLDNPLLWPASVHAKAMNEVQRFFIEDTRLGIPVDFTNEGLRGVEAYKATTFPMQIGLGHTWNRELIKNVGRIVGREARLLGYTNVYAPVLDVGRDQRWGRYEEVYGEDPYLVAELGVNMVQGMQENHQISATSKHFLAYSNNKGAREGMSRVDPQMSLHELENVHLYPWRQVISRAGLLGLMSSYNDYDGEPIQGSRYWLYERLRKDLGFKGYVVSDSDAVEYLYTKHNVAADMKEAVYQSVEAGLNVRCTFRSPDSYVLPLRELVKEGRISMETMDERVGDVLRVKFLTGLFDKPYQEDLEAADAEVDGPENNEVALKASLESLVLLKNNGVLPVGSESIRKMAVIGPNADASDFAHSHYGPLASDVVTVVKGLTDALEGKVEVAYAKGCDLVDSRWPISEILPEAPDADVLAEISRAVEIAKSSDIVVAVMGGGPRTSGENKSRSSLELPGFQNLLLKELKKTGKPLVVVLINGRPLSINWAAEHADAILEALYPGAHGGTAVAKALLGEYNPGGKLTVTFPKTVGQIPFNFPFKPSSQVDGNSKPGPDGGQTRINGALYDFGYGLSYTRFEYSDLKLSSNHIYPSDSVEVSFKVKNVGKMAGDEIVQLYIKDCISSITTYEKSLRGFERIPLQPGEVKTVTMKLGPEAFSLLDRNFRTVVEPGEFIIMVGASSTDVRLSSRLWVQSPDEVKSENKTSPAQNVYPVRMGKGEFLTLPSADVKAFAIDFASDTDGVYQIQATSGGGQFLDISRQTSQKGELKNKTFELKGDDFSEVRINVIRGVLIIDNVTALMR